MDQDWGNQYFQEYSFDYEGAAQPFNFSKQQNAENPFLADLREPYSQENHNQFGQESVRRKQDFQSTHAITSTVQIIGKDASMRLPNSHINFGETAILRYKQAFQGSKDDTMELNINFKTLLVNYLKDLSIANELTPTEVKKVQEFAERGPSFQSLKLLFKRCPQNQKLRNIILDVFSSSQCICKILQSRCQVKTKLQMIKFIEKIRVNIMNPGDIVKWKDVIKKI